MKHTPGPWKVDIWDYSLARPPRKEIVIQSEQFRLAVVDCDFVGDNPYTIAINEAEANATLIAAAPEMLEALKRIIAFPNLTVPIGYHGCLTDAIQQAISAVSKAEGK